MAVDPAKNGPETSDNALPVLSVITSVIVRFSRVISPVFSTVMVYSIRSLNPSIPSPLSLMVAVLLTTMLAIALIGVSTVLLVAVKLSCEGVVALASAVLETPPALIAC